MVLAHTDDARRSRVYVLPITHAMPDPDEAAIEIPPLVKMRLGLDTERSWIMLSEANVFSWPGPDLRPVAEAGSYGFLPPGFFRIVRDRFLALARARPAIDVVRTD